MCAFANAVEGSKHVVTGKQKEQADRYVEISAAHLARRLPLCGYREKNVHIDGDDNGYSVSITRSILMQDRYISLVYPIANGKEIPTRRSYQVILVHVAWNLLWPSCTRQFPREVMWQ